MSDDHTGVRGLWWEWLAARVVFVLGFGIPLAAYLLLTYSRPSAPAEEEAAPVAQQDTQDQQFCAQALASAQSFGIVPGFAKATGTPQKTDVTGRYVCTAATDASKYTVAVNFICKNVGDPHCYQLYAVTQDDGTVLYQRQD